MSNQIQTRALLDGVKAAVIAAWGVMADHVVYGYPVVPLALPYAVIFWNDVEVSFGNFSAVTQPQQKNTFTIYGRWPYPADATKLDLARVDRANELIARLQTGPNFIGIGFLPLVTSVERGDFDSDEAVYEVVINFEVFTLADHH